jgi:hypothetical protein
VTIKLPSGPDSRALRSPRKKVRGSAVLVVLALLSIMLILVSTNARVLSHLKREIRLIDQRQQQRLEPSPKKAPAGTNASVAVKEPRPN